MSFSNLFELSSAGLGWGERVELRRGLPGPFKDAAKATPGGPSPT